MQPLITRVENTAKSMHSAMGTVLRVRTRLPTQGLRANRPQFYRNTTRNRNQPTPIKTLRFPFDSLFSRSIFPEGRIGFHPSILPSGLLLALLW
jgi:hypothetical protein